MLRWLWVGVRRPCTGTIRYGPPILFLPPQFPGTAHDPLHAAVLARPRRRWRLGRRRRSSSPLGDHHHRRAGRPGRAGRAAGPVSERARGVLSGLGARRLGHAHPHALRQLGAASPRVRAGRPPRAGDVFRGADGRPSHSRHEGSTAGNAEPRRQRELPDLPRRPGGVPHRAAHRRQVAQRARPRHRRRQADDRGQQPPHAQRHGPLRRRSAAARRMGTA